MKKLLISVAFALAISSATAQTTQLTPHFTAESKKIVVPKASAVWPEIHEGIIAISSGGRELFVNAATGEYLFGTDFSYLRVKQDSPAYFSGGAVVVSNGNRNRTKSSLMILYPDGRYRELSNIWLAMTNFQDGVALAVKNVSHPSLLASGAVTSVKYVYVDKNGREIFPALTQTGNNFWEFQERKFYPVVEGRRLIYDIKEQKYGYADAAGKVIVKPQYFKALHFSDGLAAVQTDVNGTHKWGFIDPTGKMVIPATYLLQPGSFSEGLAPVRIGQSTYDGFEMNYIDKTGKRQMEESTPHHLNGFHGGYAWVATGCDKLYVMNREFKEVKDVTQEFYHNGNGFGVCGFKMEADGVVDPEWGFDFPDGMRMLNQGGAVEGDLFAPDGTRRFSCTDFRGNQVLLWQPTVDGLMHCRVWMQNEDGHLKKDAEQIECFINNKGEIVYYFVEAFEGFEGPSLLKFNNRNNHEELRFIIPRATVLRFVPVCRA